MPSYTAWTLLLAVLLGAVNGEAADVKVTFQSDPPGATLYSEDIPGTLKLWGYAPLILKFQVPRNWKDCIHTNPMRVRWLSGAEAAVSGIELCPQVGKNQQFTFMRPAGIPGAEIDGQFAIQLMQRQAPPPSVYVPPPAPVHCTSTVIGRQVFTNCY